MSTMKITIKTDGDQAQITPAAAPSTPTSPVPPEVAARAQAIGAMDGGAGPSLAPAAQGPPIPPTIPGEPGAYAAQDVTTAEPAISAGAAPGEYPAPSVTVEQEPDAPTTEDKEG
jgi:hypothetical protein